MGTEHVGSSSDKIMTHLHNMDGFKRWKMGGIVFSTTPTNMYSSELVSLHKAANAKVDAKQKNQCRKNGQQCSPGC